MSKLLNDEELLEHIKHCTDGQLEYYEYNKSTYSRLIDLINTQKRLYAESVIGDDEAAAEYSYLPPTLDEMTKSAHEKAVRNQLRAEQRARIR